MNSLRILHISDLHERAAFDGMPSRRKAKLDWDTRQRGQVLGEDFFDELRKVGEGGVDLVCFTGDLADWGRPEEYQQATDRMDKILKAVGVPRSRFFAVPGNHDVQRTVCVDAWKGIRLWLNHTKDGGMLGRWMLGVDDAPYGTKKAWREEILQRTSAFWEWFKDFRGAENPLHRPEPLGYRETLAEATTANVNVPIHIIGLDSSWLCGADDRIKNTVLKDQGSIFVTQEQVEAHIRMGEHRLDGLRIALVHHPLDHLADHHEVRRLLADDGVDILFHGHQHTPLTVLSAEPGAELRILAASCLIEGDLGKGWPNGFQLVEINASNRSGVVHFWKWSGRFWARGSDIYRDAPNGVLPWNARSMDGSSVQSDDGAAAPLDGTAKEPTSTHVLKNVTLSMESLRLVDMASIRQAIGTFARSWPVVQVDWPPSSSSLIEGLKCGLQGSLGADGSSEFAAHVPEALQLAGEGRTRVAEQIPQLVRRASALTDDQLTLVLRSFLLFANYEIHHQLAYYGSWNGLRPWDVPEEWKPFQNDENRRALSSLMGVPADEKGLSHGRLIVASKEWQYRKGGGFGIYIYAPRIVLEEPGPRDICRWFIPQLEYWGRKDFLPTTYDLEYWRIDIIKDWDEARGCFHPPDSDC